MRCTVGGPDCKQPYSASLLNVSAMSYGALSQNAILALNGGAKLGNFYHNKLAALLFFLLSPRSSCMCS